MNTSRHLSTSTPSTSLATLEPVRFGEFLRERNLITDEQWLAVMARHWSERFAQVPGKKTRIGATIVECGYLPAEVIEAEARIFHDDLDVIEVADPVARSEKTTLPVPPVHVTLRA